MGEPLTFPESLLVRANSTPAERRHRIMLFIVWLALVGRLLSKHVLWRDEVRAYSMALSGGDVGEMLRNLHGEGHPALWYLLLRGAHELFPYGEVLPVCGALIGIGAMALFAFRAPFRTAIVALVLFSLFGVFEYVVVARNYGISALVMFALAALYPRVRHTPWLGLMLAILCNTNVPSCILAAAFLLFRFVEVMTDERRAEPRDWLMLSVNAALALAGALLCLLTVYPTQNNGAVSSNFGAIGMATIAQAIVDWRLGFSSLTFNGGGPLAAILLLLACLSFVRKPAALAAGLAALLGLKLFFYFVYPSSYRHEALFLVLLLSLTWMVAEGAGGSWPNPPWMERVGSVGTTALVLLLAVQPLNLLKPLYLQAAGVPYSRSADVAALLRQRGLSRAIVMADPDTMLEPLGYYAENRLWFLRQQAFGRVVRLANNDRREITLDDVLADADRLHRETGGPVVFLSHLELQDARPERRLMMYADATTLTPQSVRRFRTATRLIARLRPAITDEAYDVYVYPR